MKIKRGPSPLFYLCLLRMGTKEKIEELVHAAIEDESIFVVDIQFSGNDNVRKVSVLIDSDKGLSIEDCAKVSRRLGMEIETLDLIDTAFNLEVSSPGLDKPLKLKRQYQKNLSRRLAVTKTDGNLIEGILEAVQEEFIILGTEVPDKANKKKMNLVPVEIPFAEIKKSNVIVSFK